MVGVPKITAQQIKITLETDEEIVIQYKYEKPDVVMYSTSISILSATHIASGSVLLGELKESLAELLKLFCGNKTNTITLNSIFCKLMCPTRNILFDAIVNRSLINVELYINKKISDTIICKVETFYE
jgi:hypothetical protein